MREKVLMAVIKAGDELATATCQFLDQIPQGVLATDM
jgi:hypothetical protein